MNYISEPLQTKYNKTDFLCGESLLDNYIQKQANQDIKRKLAACFVIPDSVSNRIAAYYTLSNNSIPLHEVPLELRKKLPKSYHSIPTTLLGRLPIDKNYQGRGMGKLLLIDALKRSYLTSKNIGSFAVIVDPLHDKAKRFYLKYGFIPLPDSGKMFLPMKTIGQLFT